VLAAAKPLKTANSSVFEGKMALTDSQPSAENSNSLEAMFDRHHAVVFRTAYRVTGSAADAEDVLQTVFLRVARGQESATVAENPQAYFARAAINASLDLLRRRKRSRAVAFDEVEDPAGLISLSSKKNPETTHEDRELRELIRQAVSKLGPTAAQMFALRYFEGLGNAEIAGIMKTSPLVVGVTLHRARARLRKEIGKYVRRR
jgi:RNA polymerase sigma-70 factor (ECF subfamily)